MLFTHTPRVRWLRPMHQKLIEALERANHRAALTMSSLGQPEIFSAASGVYSSRNLTYSSQDTFSILGGGPGSVIFLNTVCLSTYSLLYRFSFTITWAMAFRITRSLPGMKLMCRSAILADRVFRGSAMMILTSLPFCLRSLTNLKITGWASAM